MCVRIAFISTLPFPTFGSISKINNLSNNEFSNNRSSSFDIAGSGFFAGGTSPTVTDIRLDDSVYTKLTGYTVVNDNSITGVVLPEGVNPGIYNIKVYSNGTNNLESAVKAVVKDTSASSSVAICTDYDFIRGSNARQVVRTPNGNLVIFYWSRTAEGNYPKVKYRISNDNGNTWSAETVFDSEAV